jgi:NADPH-dependent curcumin reductase CurA
LTSVKLEWLRREVGVAAAVDYRSPGFAAELAAACPGGIDIYFAWISEGKIAWRETVMEGLEAAPEAFMGLFRGANTGKMLVRLGARDSKEV